MAGIEAKYYYLTLGLLIVCTIVGLAITYSIHREVKHDLSAPTERDLFDPLEKAYYSGLMDEAEFHRIQESIARQKGQAYKPNPKKGRPKPDQTGAKPPVILTEHPPVSDAETESDEEI